MCCQNLTWLTFSLKFVRGSFYCLMLFTNYLTNFSIQYFLIWLFSNKLNRDVIVVLSQSERLFEQALKKESGYIVRKMKKDGACLFRAVGKNLKVKNYIHEKMIHYPLNV